MITKTCPNAGTPSPGAGAGGEAPEDPIPIGTSASTAPRTMIRRTIVPLPCEATANLRRPSGVVNSRLFATAALPFYVGGDEIAGMIAMRFGDPRRGIGVTGL